MKCVIPLRYLTVLTNRLPEISHHTTSSNDVPQVDGDLKNTSRKQILHYLQIYWDLYDPIVFMSVTMNTGHLHDGLLRLFFLHTHREDSDMTGVLPEESD